VADGNLDTVANVEKEPRVNDELVELLRRQVAALEMLEGRLRTLELLAAAGEQRFVAVAFDELELAAERVGALELIRALSMADMGLDPDASAEQVVAATDGGEEGPVAAAVRMLRVAAERAGVARERARLVVSDGYDEISRRLEASGALAGV
jgi:hypothetical protein